MREAFDQVWFGRARVVLGAAVVLAVVNQTMVRYPSRGHGEAVLWLCADLLLFAGVARGSRGAWRILGGSTAFGAALFLIAGVGAPSGSQLSCGLLFAAQLVLLFSPAVRSRWEPSTRRRHADAAAGR